MEEKVMQLGVAGYPSKLGGADTELLHQLRCWVAMGIDIHIVHTGRIDRNLKKMGLEDMQGVTIHKPRDWKHFKGMPVVGYCSGPYLEALPEIREYASCILWANCMSWLFPEEIRLHEEGMIDWFIYQTDRNIKMLGKKLSKINPDFNAAKISPYFDAKHYKFTPDPPDDKFRFCKISRADADKYHPATWWLYDNFTAPKLKEGHILGWDANKMLKKCGEPPDWIFTMSEGQVPVEEIYAKSHAMIHYADPSQSENLPRVGFEAMATGTLLVVDNRGGWKEEVIDGSTGWLCDNDREFSYKASRVAFDSSERIEMAKNARDHLSSEWGMDAAQRNWSEFFDRVLD